MKKILVVLSSVRDGRTAEKVKELVQAELKNYDEFEISVADFKETPLPFFDSGVIPSAPEFKPTDKNVVAWGKQVAEADAVIMLVAEYNHSYTAILKNALDWLYPEWNEKTVALIGYGWVGGARATAHLRGVLASNLAANTLETEANLRFMKEINTDGSVIDDDSTSEAIVSVLDAIKDTVLEPETIV